MFYRIGLLLMLLAMFSTAAPAEQQDQNVAIAPDGAVQSFLKSLSSTNAPKRQNVSSSETEKDLSQKLIELQEKAGGAQELVRQLLYFGAQSKSTREGMLPWVIIEQMNISQDDIRDALIPCFETDDRELLREVHEWLEGVDYDRSAKRYAFASYEKVIRDARNGIPQGLIKYMYETSPDVAFSSMATVYLDKDDAKALIDQVKGGDEAQAVDRLSKRPEWWAKLYAAEKMKQNPKLRDPELIERLKKSKNPAVSATVQKIEDEKK